MICGGKTLRANTTIIVLSTNDSKRSSKPMKTTTSSFSSVCYGLALLGISATSRQRGCTVEHMRAQSFSSRTMSHRLRLLWNMSHRILQHLVTTAALPTRQRWTCCTTPVRRLDDQRLCFKEAQFSDSAILAL